MCKSDLEYFTKSFFDTFNIPIRELTLDDRDFLEQILLEDYWTLEYMKDQWCSVIAKHVHYNDSVENYINNDIEVPENLEIWIEDYKYTGEGDSCLTALLNLYLIAKPILSKEVLISIKERFS